MLKDKLFSQAAEEKKLASEERGFDLLDRPTLLHSAARHPGARPPESNSTFRRELPGSESHGAALLKLAWGREGLQGRARPQSYGRGEASPSPKETGKGPEATCREAGKTQPADAGREAIGLSERGEMAQPDPKLTERPKTDRGQRLMSPGVPPISSPRGSTQGPQQDLRLDGQADLLQAPHHSLGQGLLSSLRP